jgi:uncharacterized protein YbbC (DUF1343 family)
MKKLFSVFLIISFNISVSCAGQNEDTFLITEEEKLTLGADRLINEFTGLILNKRLGVVTNHTGVTANGTHIVDTLHSLGYEITALFGPEHGIRGDAPAGEKILDGVDAKTGISVFSLYGQHRKPTDEMLSNVDILIFDIQDIGARFYTYISTLFYIVQAGAEKNIPVIVLDRPNPIGGLQVEGPIRKENLSSFVGIAPIPVRHGMTVGELATLFAGEGYIGKNLKSQLPVIEVLNWKRENYFDQFEMEWIPPSPNIPKFETSIVYPGTCLIEGTNVSEGRGTMDPFLTIGAPYIIPRELINELNKWNIEGISYSPAAFTPEEIKGMASKPKYENQNCFGISITVIDKEKFNAVNFGIKLIYSLNKIYPKQFSFRESSFDRLIGDEQVRIDIQSGLNPEQVITRWREELDNFISLRNKYLLY